MWVSLCCTKYKAFCTDCMKAKAHGLPTFNKRIDEAFISTGFCNWKKATSKSKEHESSHFHKEAQLKLASFFSKQPDIVARLNNEREIEQKKNRAAFLIVLSSIRYLARQDMSIRGHSEKDGNLYRLLKERASEMPRLNKWLEDGRYMSHDIINEVVKLMGITVLQKLIAEVKASGFYAILADETRDLSNKEQLVVCMRWVDVNFSVYEDPVGLYLVPNTTASTLFTAIKDVLLRCSFPVQQCRGQGYDGASNMMGRLNGVAKKFLEIQNSALPVHCLAHCTNLVLQDLCKAVKTVREVLKLVKDISRLIKFSPKNEILFVENQISVSGHLESGEQPIACKTVKP